MARSTNLIVPEILEQEMLRQSAEKLDMFNEASLGTIVLADQPAYQALNGGDEHKTVRIKRPASLVTAMDLTAPTGTASTVALAQGSGLGVVWKGKIGPATYTDDEVLQGAKTPEDYSVAVAELFASERLLKIRNLALAAASAAIDSADTTDGSTSSANIHIKDVSAGKVSVARGKATRNNINLTLAKMGDARDRIRTIVMRSEVEADLFTEALSSTFSALETAAGQLLRVGDQALFGKRILVADAAGLRSALTSSYYTAFSTLGLGVGAIKATIVHSGPVEVQRVVTTEVPYTLVRQDFSVLFQIAGMKWVTTTVPTDALLATAASWDEDYEDHRDFPIVKLVSNATVD